MPKNSNDTSAQQGAHLLMNVVDEEELRVAVIRDGHLESLVHERLTTTLQLGNIYKAKVTNVEPSLDAAFLDLGGDKNGFIHVDDLRHGKGDKVRIEDLIKSGQELVVQIVKEAIRDKGPCVTQQLSIPGRYLVLVSDAEGKRGVSKKIADDATRRRLKAALGGFETPKGFGYIVRTAGADRLPEELELDHAYLTQVWQAIEERSAKVSAPSLLYQEADVVVRSLRDLVSADTVSVIIDKQDMYEDARDFARIFMPELADRIRLHEEKQPLFSAYGVEERLASVLEKQVELPSGGNIVIEQTEALVSIDVNSAKNRSADNVEETALLTNLEAVHVIAEQLLLRDLGGLIIIDFIDMEDREHQRLVQLGLRRALLNDPSKTHVAAISRFGLVEMTRQRRRPSHRLLSSTECPWCNGAGHMKTIETLAIESLRAVRGALNKQACARVEVLAPPEVAIGILNVRGAEIAALSEEHDCAIQYSGDPLMKSRSFRLQVATRKRRRGRRTAKGDEPVRPSLLAPLVEQQSAMAAEARSLSKRKARDVEREILQTLDGGDDRQPASGRRAPSDGNGSSAPPPSPVADVDSVQVNPALEAMARARQLRRLLFGPVEEVRVDGDRPPLASASQLATKAPPRAKRRRSRRR